MPDDGLSEGCVTRAELAELAELFDRFEFALDPLSRDAEEAEARFNSRVQFIFEEHIRPRRPQLSFVIFRARVRNLCRVFLKKNPP